MVMDVSDSAGQYFASAEASHEAACYAAAQAAELTKEQADKCEAGEHKCDTCPWRDD